MSASAANRNDPPKAGVTQALPQRSAKWSNIQNDILRVRVQTFLPYLIAGWSGFFVMAVELLGGRLLAPTFGSSVYVWGAIITVFMLALSLGYLAGGRYSLHSPSVRRLGALLVIAAVTATPLLFVVDTLL